MVIFYSGYGRSPDPMKAMEGAGFFRIGGGR